MAPNDLKWAKNYPKWPKKLPKNDIYDLKWAINDTNCPKMTHLIAEPVLSRKRSLMIFQQLNIKGAFLEQCVS